MSAQKNDYLVKLADRNPIKGRLYEPRGYWDWFNTDLDPNSNLVAVRDHGNVFRNNEQYPVVIKNIVFSARYGLTYSDFTYRAGMELPNLRIRFMRHDHSHQNRNFIGLRCFANTQTNVPESVGTGAVVWTFPRPFILSARDSLQIQIGDESNVASEYEATTFRQLRVAFTGCGVQSGRQYLFESLVVVTDQTTTTLPTEDFHNGGTEPIAITRMVVMCTGPQDFSADTLDDASGDAWRVRLQVRQLGNGTGQEWFTGPVGVTTPNLPNLDIMPASLLGMSGGHALVHTLPGDGWIWEPGEGVSPELLSSVLTANFSEFLIGMFGYIVVQ